jgi:long-chain acyl-CoA synthetase
MMFFTQLQRHADAGLEAVRSDAASLSYGELLERVEQEAGNLFASGIDAGSVVGVAIVDEIEHYVACLALLRLGAWQITIAAHDTATLHHELMRRTGATHLLTDRTVAAPLAVALLHWPLPNGAKVAARGDQGGLFCRTSGTTGASNLVPLSEASVVAQARRNPEYLGARYLRPASIEHNNGKRHRLFCAYVGGTNVFGNSDRQDLAAFCARHSVSRMDVSSMHAADLVATAGPGDFSKLDIYVAGSGTPFSLRMAIEQKVTRRLFTRYAATEFGTIAICRPGEHDEQESVGRPVGGVELEVVDETGQVMPRGEAGHIRLRGDGMANGYHDSPEQTARRFREGWFWPGDIGSLNPDGTLTIRGRADEMINLNGINIFPAEIERVLMEHGEVSASAATALASTVHGQIPVAVVELTRGASATTRDLLLFARERLALRAPRKILIVDTLPRNSQGKIVRRALAPLFGAQRREN